MSKSTVKTFVFGGFFGAVLAAIIGFSAGWIVTSGGSNAKAVAMSEAAVKDQLVPICMHQFNSQGDSAAKLDSLRAIDTWKREEFLDAEGFANMPGSTSSVRGIARECAVRLLADKS